MVIRLVVTLVGVAVYLVGRSVHLPFVDVTFYQETIGPVFPRATWLALGIAPFVSGFVLVELVSLIIPWGRRLRTAGIAGRKKLNRVALAVGSVVALVQAHSLAGFLAGLPTRPGGPTIPAPQVVLFATVAAASFAALGLGGLLSRWGLGNGIAVLFVSDHLGSALFDLWPGRSGGEPLEPEQLLMSGLLTAGVVAVLVPIFRYSRRAVVESRASGPLPFRIPAFPQGTLAVYWTHLVFRQIFHPLWRDEPLLELGTWEYVAASAISLILISALAAWMFSALPRVRHNLKGVAEVQDEPYRAAWRRQLLQTTAFLVLAEAGVFLGHAFFPHGAARLLLYVTGAMVLVATGLDLYDEGRLIRSCGRVERVLTLDNVHLAEYLRSRLTADRVPCVIRAYHLRRLGYFFSPLFKMALLVPAAEAERAARLVDETPFEIV